MSTLRLRELAEILTQVQGPDTKHLYRYNEERNKGSRYIYKLQSMTGGTPSNGMFTLNAASLENSTILELPVDDFFRMTRVEPAFVTIGNLMILTRQDNMVTKCIYKITGNFPIYSHDTCILGYTLTMTYLAGSKYSPTSQYENFYIEFGRNDNSM
jgi:hypothetical protein